MQTLGVGPVTFSRSSVFQKLSTNSDYDNSLPWWRERAGPRINGADWFDASVPMRGGSRTNVVD